MAGTAQLWRPCLHPDDCRLRLRLRRRCRRQLLHLRLRRHHQRASPEIEIEEWYWKFQILLLCFVPMVQYLVAFPLPVYVLRQSFLVPGLPDCLSSFVEESLES